MYSGWEPASLAALSLGDNYYNYGRVNNVDIVTVGKL
jgi:hypothetical protein